MVTTTDLEAYYKLDESSGTIYDSTSNDNDGTYNGALYSQTGKINTAIGFDGSNDYIDLGASVIPTTSNADFTISAWIYWNGDTGGSVALSQYTGGTSGRFNAIQILSTGALNVFLDGTQSNSGTTYINEDEWTHIVIVRDSGTITGYINNNSVLSFSKSSSVESTNTFIGTDAYGSSNHFNGDIDEVGIWSRALTSTERSDLYNSGDGLAYPFTTSTGWSGKILGITPGKVQSIAKADISKIQGVE